MGGRAGKESGEPVPRRWGVLGLLLAFSFLSWFNRTSIAVAYDLRLGKQFGINDEQIGLVYSAFFLAYAVFMAPAGWFSDRMGARVALTWVGLGSALFVALAAAAGAVDQGAPVELLGWTVPPVLLFLLVVRFCMGLFTAPIYPASGRAVGNWIPAARRAGANGLITGAALVGNAFTWVGFGFLIDHWDWPVAFLASGIMTALVALLWLGYARDCPAAIAHPGDTAGPVNRPQPVESSKALLFNRSLWLLTLSYATIGYFEYLFFFWMHHYFVDVLDLDRETPHASRYYTMIVNLSMAGGMVLGGWLADRLTRSFGSRRGRAAVAVGGMAAGALFLVVGLRAEQVALVVTAFALALAGIGATEGPFWTTAIELGRRRSATAFGIFNTGGNVGGLLAPFLTPLIKNQLPEAWGDLLRWKVALVLSGAYCLVGAVLWLWIDPNEGAVGENPSADV